MIIGWIVLSVLCGIYASNKGKSFFGYFILAILLSPLIGFVAAMIAKDESKSLKSNTISDEDSQVNQKSNISVSDEIIKLNELKEKGILTEEEFNEQKKKLLKQQINNEKNTTYITLLRHIICL